MYRLLLCLLLLSPAILFADDTFRVEIRMVELDSSAPAPTEFPPADSPLSATIKVKAGQLGAFDSGSLLRLPDLTSNTTTDIPVGITLHVTPVLKGTQLTYRAKVTHSVPIFQTRASNPESAAEVKTSTFYQSGPCEPGVPLWFNYLHPNKSKTMFIALRFHKDES